MSIINNLPHWSRYKDTKEILWGGSESFGLYIRQEKFSNLTANDLINIKITTGLAGRPDLISQKYYRTPYYSWVIIMHNSPLNPIGWPRQGDLISIPKPAVVDSIIHG